MSTEPSAEASATADPETPAKSMEATTLTWASSSPHSAHEAVCELDEPCSQPSCDQELTGQYEKRDSQQRKALGWTEKTLCGDLEGKSVRQGGRCVPCYQEGIGNRNGDGQQDRKEYKRDASHLNRLRYGKRNEGGNEQA